MPPRFTDDELDKNVLCVLQQHQGKANPIGRWELVAAIYGGAVPEWMQNDENLADRQIRESVSRLRRRGVLICDQGDGSGRFLAQSLEEYQAFRMRYGGRAFQVMETLREMDKAAEHIWPNELQPRLI